MVTEPTQFVAFVDMLGFRALVLSNTVPRPSTLAPTGRMGWSGLLDLMGDVQDIRNPLRRSFVSFHEILAEQLREVGAGDTLTAVVFSDSFFLATPDWGDCLQFCQRYMRSCIDSKVPIRIGVGCGSFSGNRFAIETMERVRIVSTQFLGSAVVFATDAEKAIKGMRIALHPTVLRALPYTNAKPYKFLALPADQASSGATHEWNYADSSFVIGERPKGIDAQALIERVVEMRQDVPRAPEVQVHYEATLSALERMAVEQADYVEEDFGLPEEPDKE